MQLRRRQCGGGMARGACAACCSYRTLTVVVCCVNLIAALFVLRSFYDSYLSSSGLSGRQFAEAQTKRIRESIEVRTALEPADLVKEVRKLKKELSRQQKKAPTLPQSLKQKLAFEILQTLDNVTDAKNIAELRAAVELWRVNKLGEVKRAASSKLALNSSIPYQEAKMLKRALDLNWLTVMEDIGLWMPAEFIHTEHNDKRDNEHDPEEDIIPGRPLPLECHAELHTDYDGAAVRWGLTHHKESAADCCQACLDQAKHSKPGEMKCNIWVYCPSEFGCYSPDKYEHKHQECWLKQAEKPWLNFKNKYSESYRRNHPTAPVVVPWISGVVG